MSLEVQSEHTKRGPLAILIAALLWSTGGLFIKSVTLDAWSVSLWRSTIAAITIAAIYSWKRESIQHDEGESWTSPHLFAIAFFYALLLVLFVIATKLTTSANAIFLQYTAPIYILFAEPLLTHSKLKRADLLTVAIATAAMALFFIGQFDTRSIWGNMAALASGIAFATFALLLKLEHASEAVRWRAVIVGHGIIAIAMVILALLGYTNPLPHSSNEVLMLLYLGLVQIGIAYAIFTYGIAHVRAIDATLLCMVEPVLNPVWVFIGIGERPTNYAILGGVIILGVVAFRAIAAGRTIEAPLS